MRLSFIQQDIIEQLIFGNQADDIAEQINVDPGTVETELTGLVRDGLLLPYPLAYAGKVSDFFAYVQTGGIYDGIEN